MISGDNHKTLNRTRIDVYETLCPQQMLVHKGGKIRNWVGECRDVTPTKLQTQNIFKESKGGRGRWGGGQDGCERRIKVFVKMDGCERRIKVFVIKKYIFFGSGGGRVGLGGSG